MEGYIFRVHDGRAYRPVMVKPHMIGTTFGDHVHTKQICVYRRKKNRKQKKMVKGKSLKIKAKSKSKAKVKQKT
jgi:hypothetical protein